MIYMDNAATTLQKPPQVIKAVADAMTCMGNAGRGVNDGSLNAARIVYGAREKLAGLFSAEDVSCIVFTNNSTESLNIAIQGILQKGDHVITTCLEHNSVLRPLYYMQTQGVEVSIVQCDDKGRVSPEEIKSNMKENTKAIVCTNGSNLTGNYIDVGEIGAFAREKHVLLIVDASQTAGVFDIDVQKTNIDILCFTGHKGLLGPQGTGGMYVRTGVEIAPLKYGGTGIETYSKYQPKQMPTHLESGTLNGHGIAGLSAAIDYITDLGIGNIRHVEQNLMFQFYNGIRDIPSIKIYGDFSTTNRCAIVSFNIGEFDSAQISDILFNEYCISTRSGGHCAPLLHESLGTKEQGAVRFSFSHYNTEQEVEIAINAIKDLAGE